MSLPYNVLDDSIIEELFTHLHVHYEYSLLDGLSKVKEIIAEAKRLGQKAVGMTDHGVMGGIAEFITECEKQGIKPLPGVEAYLTKDRLIQSEKMKEKREAICLKYKIVTGKKKLKPKLKVLGDFIRMVEKNWSKFDEEAPQLIKDYLMEEPSKDTSAQFSLFEVDLDIETKPRDGIEEFKRDILDYLDYDNYHMVLLAINNEGLEDLYEINSDAHINGFYSDPRTDLAFIRSRGLGKNIIATSACLGSYFAKLVSRGQIQRAKEHIAECKETFHSFYLEKQATTIPLQIELNRIIDQLAIETNTPKIVTTDVHFCKKDEWATHDVLTAASFQKCLGDDSRYSYSTDHYMKSESEIRELVNDDEAIANTAKIAELVNVTLPKEPLFPKFLITGDETAEELLKKKAWNGLMQYMFEFPNLDVSTYSRRLDYELGVITKEGFSDYFLIVSDYCEWAINNEHMTGPGRGSAAGSLVAMCISITDVDPIEYGLMFERFLSPDRISYPDIDCDFPYETCIAIIRYLQEKYGKWNVAQIGTYGTLAARSVIRIVGKTLEENVREIDTFAKSIPDKPGTTLEDAYKQEEKVRLFADTHSKWWETAKTLEGHIRSEGTHAGGVVLSPQSLTKTLPLRVGSDDLETTQFDMAWVEKYLVKFDILKLDTLKLVKNTMKMANIWGKVNIKRINLNDPNVYEAIYKKGLTSGVFQVESDGMKKTLREMKADSFSDIVAALALYRPGPMDFIPTYIARKHGREPVRYDFPACEDILKETYGVLVYQEQAMQMSVRLGGLTAGQSDYVRAGIAKKKIKLIDEWVGYMIYGSHEQDSKLIAEGKPPLNIPGALSKGYTEKEMLKLKEEWIKFGEYCFNKSHSVAYAKLSLQTAWLKTYYPVEFMAALLTGAEGKKDSKSGDNKQIKYMGEAEEMGITILPADINTSKADWTPNAEEKTIRYGLASIAKISSPDYEIIKRLRPFHSFEHFLELNDETMKLKKDKVEALIKSGSFDKINSNRNLLLRNYYKHRGDSFENIPMTTGKRTIMEYERECFGTTITIKSRWDNIEDGKEGIQITGLVTMLESWTAKTGKVHYKAIVATAEDERPLIIWGYLMDRHKGVITLGNKVQLQGKKSGEDLIVNSIKLLDSPNLAQYEVVLS